MKEVACILLGVLSHQGIIIGRGARNIISSSTHHLPRNNGVVNSGSVELSSEPASVRNGTRPCLDFMHAQILTYIIYCARPLALHRELHEPRDTLGVSRSRGLGLGSLNTAQRTVAATSPKLTVHLYCGRNPPHKILRW